MEQILRDTISDLVGSFLYYDRKEDDGLPVGMIEQMISSDPDLLEEIIIAIRSDILAAMKASNV